MNANANPSQAFYQPHTAPKIGPSASSTSSFFVPIVNPINVFPAKTQTYNLPFFGLNKSVKTFDGLDHQDTLGKYLH